MKKRLTALFIAVILSLALLGSASAAPYYSDTADLPAWAAESVDFVTKYGLMNGVGGGMFDPNSYANRAMAATLIWRLAGKPEAAQPSMFADVEAGQWYSGAIDWAAGKKIANGSYGYFRPLDFVSRQDLVLMLYRYAGSPVSDVTVLSYFKDFTQVSAYAANALAWAVQKGILLGSEGSLLPKESATRAQLAAILTRYLKLNPDQIPEQVLPDPTPDPEPEPEEPTPELPEQDALPVPPTNDSVSPPGNDAAVEDIPADAPAAETAPTE